MQPPDCVPCDLAALYAELRQPIYQFALRRLRDPEAARDVLQDVFLRAHSNATGLREPRRVQAWIWSIAHHAVIDRIRRDKPVSGLDPEWPSPVPSEADLALDALLESVPRCIECLPPPYQEALHLTVIEGLDQNQLAARLGISRSGARSRVQRARVLLGALYRKYCAEEVVDCGMIREDLGRNAR